MINTLCYNTKCCAKEKHLKSSNSYTSFRNAFILTATLIIPLFKTYVTQFLAISLCLLHQFSLYFYKSPIRPQFLFLYEASVVYLISQKSKHSCVSAAWIRVEGSDERRGTRGKQCPLLASALHFKEQNPAELDDKHKFELSVVRVSMTTGLRKIKSK